MWGMSNPTILSLYFQIRVCLNEAFLYIKQQFMFININIYVYTFIHAMTCLMSPCAYIQGLTRRYPAIKALTFPITWLDLFHTGLKTYTHMIMYMFKGQVKEICSVGDKSQVKVRQRPWSGQKQHCTEKIPSSATAKLCSPGKSLHLSALLPLHLQNGVIRPDTPECSLLLKHPWIYYWRCL